LLRNEPANDKFATATQLLNQDPNLAACFDLHQTPILPLHCSRNEAQTSLKGNSMQRTIRNTTSLAVLAAALTRAFASAQAADLPVYTKAKAPAVEA
jgi:hypothetical protein